MKESIGIGYPKYYMYTLSHIHCRSVVVGRGRLLWYRESRAVFSDTYIKTKETSPLELVSLCGRDTNYRTFIESVTAVAEFSQWLEEWLD